MSKIKELEKNLRQLKRKEKAVRLLKKKKRKVSELPINCFVLFMVLTFLALTTSLTMGFVLKNELYIEWCSKGVLSVCMLSLSMWLSSEMVSNFLIKKIDKRIDKIKELGLGKKEVVNVKDLGKKEAVNIQEEDLSLYIKELSSMSDEDVNRIPSVIINEIINKKQELENKEANDMKNAEKLASIKIRNSEVMIENN